MIYKLIDNYFVGVIPYLTPRMFEHLYDEVYFVANITILIDDCNLEIDRSSSNYKFILEFLKQYSDDVVIMSFKEFKRILLK